MNQPLLRSIPWWLTASRLLLAAALVGGAVAAAPPWLFAVILASAFWFDIIDGVLARRLGADTPALRRFDSRSDVLFFLAVVAAIAIAQPAIFTELLPWLVVLLACEAACQLLSRLRFRCGTSTHSWLCKAWAVLLFYSAARVLVAGETGWPVYATLGFGCLAYADVAAILLIARRSPVDVPSAWHAWRSRPASLDMEPGGAR